MKYDDYLSWFKSHFNRDSEKSWKWPKAWYDEQKYWKKSRALKQNKDFCENIDINFTRYSAPQKLKKNIYDALKK